MKKITPAKILNIILTIITLTFIVSAYKVEPNKEVHQYIAKEAKDVWPLIPYEIKQNINLTDYNASLDTTGYDTGEGENILIGAGEEDTDNCPLAHQYLDVILSGFRQCPYYDHLWDPDYPDGGINDLYTDDYNKGYDTKSNSNYYKARILWKDKVIPLYLKGDVNQSYYWLGRVVHLLEDATVPAHTHLDPHGTLASGEDVPLIGDDAFEEYSAIAFKSYLGIDYSGKQYNYENLPNTENFNWSSVEPKDKRFIELFRLFWYSSQKSQFQASDDADGNSKYRRLSDDMLYDLPNLWLDINVTIVSNKTSLIDDDNNTNNNGTDINHITNATLPHAMRAVAGLYRLFWDTVHSYDWPTSHHDNLRNAYTILKGDMQSAAHIDNYNLYMTNGSSQEFVIRTSIADIDGNGYMEAVSIGHEKIDPNETNGKIFTFERNLRFNTCPSFFPFCWRDERKWLIDLHRIILYPPTIGNIDGTTQKEVIVPTRNGTLRVLNVSTDGKTVYDKWQYLTVPKFSTFSGNNHTAELSGSAIADIDLDGNPDIVIVDSAPRSV